MSLIETVLTTPFYLYETFAFVALYPVIRVFERAGLQNTYALLLPIPVVGLVACLGVLALKPWPASKSPLPLGEG